MKTRKQGIKVSLLLLVAALLCLAGAAWAGGNGDGGGNNTPGCDQDKVAAQPDLKAAYHNYLASGGKEKSQPGMMLACDNQPCNNRPDIEGKAGAIRTAQPQPHPQAAPGTQLACVTNDCLSPGLNDERRATAPKSPILVCIESVCELRRSLDATLLTCTGGVDCFAPDNQAQQTTTR